MLKLHQLIAIKPTVVSNGQGALTAMHHRTLVSALFSGLTKTYEPFDEEDRQSARAPEGNILQETVANLLDQRTGWRPKFVKMLDTLASLDVTNTTAKADLVVDGVTIATGLPAVTLIGLEKKLIDLRTVVSKLPTLDPSVHWTWDGANGCWSSEPVITYAKEKTLKSEVVVQATDKFPAQVKEMSKDVNVGIYTTVRTSGAIAPSQRDTMLDRITKLLEAVKQARQAANDVEVVPVDIGEALLNYIFIH